MKLDPMKPAPPVTKIVCRINISLPRGDQHAGMPRGCHRSGKRSIVIKKDGLSPSIPRSASRCLARLYLSRPPLVENEPQALYNCRDEPCVRRHVQPSPEASPVENIRSRC